MILLAQIFVTHLCYCNKSILELVIATQFLENYPKDRPILFSLNQQKIIYQFYYAAIDSMKVDRSRYTGFCIGVSDVRLFGIIKLLL